MAKKKDELSEPLLNIDGAVETATSFYEQYKNIILGVGGGLIVLILGYYAYKNLFIAPKQKEAVQQMSKAEALFAKDSFTTALNSPGGGFPGFIEIAKKYSGTPAGNIANYYAGVCLLNTAKPADAQKYLEDFNPDGKILPIMKYSLLGDAYADQNQMDKALDTYQKAAKMENNIAITPFILMKAGMLAEKLGKKDIAINAYKTIKEEFGNTAYGRNIDKYLYRLTD